MARESVAKEAIEAARVEFLRRRIAWEDHEDGGIDEHDAEDDVDGSYLHVEIARNVTAAMVKRIPKAWLSGVEVHLNPNGVLELVDAETYEHNQGKGCAGVKLNRYAASNRAADQLMATIAMPHDFCNETRTPDAMLWWLYPRTARTRRAQRLLPAVVVDVGMSHHSLHQCIQRARLYLSEPHVQRVVVFKFFRPRSSGRRQHPPLLQKAALAVVFERAGAFQRGALADIQVVDEVSFGTAPLGDSVYQDLSEVPSRNNAVAAQQHQHRVIAASPCEQIDILTSNVRTNFHLMPAHVLDVRFDPTLPEIPFDLRGIMQGALDGWYADRHL